MPGFATVTICKSSTAFRRGAMCLLLALAALPAWADPDGTDPVTRFLEDRGLLVESPIPLWEPPMVRQVRDAASDLVLSAMKLIGVRYRRGGTSADQGFDCSGFTRYIYNRSVGLVLPRSADEQAADPALIKIDKSELKPGDLVFFNTLKRTFSHVGIYVGDGKFIHAPRAGTQVRVEDMGGDYWMRRYTGARRVPQVIAGADAAHATGNP